MKTTRFTAVYDAVANNNTIDKYRPILQAYDFMFLLVLYVFFLFLSTFVCVVMYFVYDLNNNNNNNRVYLTNYITLNSL